MIIKIKTYKRPAYRKLLEYMTGDKGRLFDASGKSFVITHNLRGKSVVKWVEQFQKNETYRLHKRKNSIYLNHEIISWHQKDSGQMTLSKLEDMTREYIRQRGIQGMYVAVPHFDKDHYHVHICSSALQYKTGRSMRMSRQEFSDLKKGVQEYQVEKFPELSHSVVLHGRKRRGISGEKEHQFKTRTGKMSKREELLSLISSIYTQSSSPEEFIARLEGCKLQTYVRGGKVYGVMFGKKKYRFKKLGIDLEQFPKQEIERLREGKRKDKRRVGR